MKNFLLGKSNLSNLLIIFGGISNVFIVACEPQKYTECEQMITLANDFTEQTQTIAESSSDRDQDLNNWLEASEIMKLAARDIENLEIKDTQLIEYQGSLANIYRGYSQATYSAVKARESRDLQALRSARDDAEDVAEKKNNLVKSINDYCLKQ
ncbi:hypothetical protein Xen7305DRAFT_00009260 [Xenococcus sp. PCC 7305]|uniref:hypothetical protein n=1 Tax=Xenococcus sp. PCC 7305 TaxID=102125 RepID=UPI0002AC7F9B|nr:hypothetical protein [Xenococcus sp. PCC 7305]ELS01224.1 hypothetical protein Xen7305DRAFT_00009260 [Xenococcus sp. PCC 7305]